MYLIYICEVKIIPYICILKFIVLKYEKIYSRFKSRFFRDTASGLRAFKVDRQHAAAAYVSRTVC